MPARPRVSPSPTDFSLDETHESAWERLKSRKKGEDDPITFYDDQYDEDGVPFLHNLPTKKATARPTGWKERLRHLRKRCLGRRAKASSPATEGPPMLDVVPTAARLAWIDEESIYLETPLR